MLHAHHHPDVVWSKCVCESHESFGSRVDNVKVYGVGGLASDPIKRLEG